MSTPDFRHLLKSRIALKYDVLLVLHHIKVLIKPLINYFLVFIKFDSLRHIISGSSFILLAHDTFIIGQPFFKNIGLLKLEIKGGHFI